jgi:hypothetical protein
MPSNQFNCGAEIFKSITRDLAPTLRVHRLNKAVNLYEQATGVTASGKDLALAHKNAAVVHLKLAMLTSDGHAISDATPPGDHEPYYYGRMLRQACLARTHAASVDNPDWLPALLQLISDGKSAIISRAGGLPDEPIDFFEDEDDEDDCAF